MLRHCKSSCEVRSASLVTIAITIVTISITSIMTNNSHITITNTDRQHHHQEEHQRKEQEKVTLLIGDSMKKSLSIRGIEEAAQMSVVSRSAYCSVPDWEGAKFPDSSHEEILNKELSKVSMAGDICLSKYFVTLTITNIDHNAETNENS